MRRSSSQLRDAPVVLQVAERVLVLAAPRVELVDGTARVEVLAVLLVRLPPAWQSDEMIV